jgi:hypothetical protein
VADWLDTAGRLAEGRPAVEHTERYVRACEALGYEHPDLQILDWYDSEEGLDLRALDGDCAELRAAAGAVEEALRLQRAQVGELAAAWTGSGADSAVRFLQRHCDAANTVAAEVRAAAQRCEALRDNLWHLLDVKVATAIAIDDRAAAQRSAWLAAADAVISGVGDRPTAEELVQQQVKPYVDNDIRNDWLSAMRSTQAGVAASYDMVTDRMSAAPRAYFEIPGDLAPVRPPLQPVPRSPAAPAAVAPAAFTGGEAAPATAPLTPAAASLPTPPMPDMGSGLGDASALPTGGGGLGGLGGLASRIVEAMGDLLDSAPEQPSDPLDAEDGQEDDDEGDTPDGPADPMTEKAPDTTDSGPMKEADDAEDAVRGQPVAAPAPPPVAGPPVDAPTPEPPLVSGPPPAPQSERSTPCEIAADALPQAGQ